jgi:pantoate--beta-alanine ligase
MGQFLDVPAAETLAPPRTRPSASSARARRLRVIRSPSAMARLADGWGTRQAVLVPTMGALHAGHMALVERARRAAGPEGLVILSSFVNPTQFGPKEDLSRYPRPWRRDLALCRRHGVDIVFHPEAEAMYSEDKSVVVDETLLSAGLCGAARPGHFRGVCTVVAKLFNLVRPRAAVFGRKDFQQLAVIRRMVRDLNFPVKILDVETVREAGGLALSSRNVYLDAAARAQAPALWRALRQAAAAARAGERDGARLLALVAAEIEANAPLARLDYLELIREADLRPVSILGEAPAVIALAAFFGRTRLIDHIAVRAA